MPAIALFILFVYGAVAIGGLLLVTVVEVMEYLCSKGIVQLKRTFSPPREKQP